MSIIQKAMVCLVVLLSTKTNAQLWKEYADSARAYQNKKSFDSSVGYYEKAILILKKDSAGKSDYIKLITDLGLFYLGQRNYEKAELNFKEVNDVLTRLNQINQVNYVTNCNYLGAVYYYTGQFQKSEQYWLETRNLTVKILGKNSNEYGKSCNNLGNVYQAMGEYGKAKDYFMEGLSVKERILGKNHPSYASSCNNMGSFYLDLGQYEKAIQFFIEAKEIWGKTVGTSDPEYLMACKNLGISCKYIGQFKQAETQFYEVKDILEKTNRKNTQLYTAILSELGGFYNSIGQLEKAESYYLHVSNLLEKITGKMSPDYAGNCNNLGALYKDMKKYQEAERVELEGLNIFEALVGKEHPYYAGMCNNIGELYRAMLQYEKAESFMLRAKDLREKIFGKDHPDYASSCNILGKLYSTKGMKDRAEQLLLESLQINEQLFNHDNIAISSFCNDVGDFYWKVGTHEKAEKYFRKAFESQIGQVKKIFEFASEHEKEVFLNLIRNANQKYLSFYYSYPDTNDDMQAYAVSLNSRGLILSSLRQLKNSINDGGDTVLLSAYQKWVDIREQLAYWYTRPFGENPKLVTELENEGTQIEKKFTRLRASEGSINFGKSVTASDIQKRIAEDEAAVEFIEFSVYNGTSWTDSTFYAALILRKHSTAPEFIKLFEKKQLDSLLNYKGTSPGASRTNYLYSTSTNNSLYNLIWAPLEPKLAGIKRIFYAPAGSLHKISIAGLPVNNSQFVSDKYRMIQMATTASIIDSIDMSILSTDKLLLYGGVQYDADSVTITDAAKRNYQYDVESRSLPEQLSRDGVPEFIYLKGAEREVTEISQMAKLDNFTSKKYTGLNATEESFKSLSGKNSPAVLHIATHGFFFPDPKGNYKDERAGGSVVFKQSDNPLIRSGLALAGANNAWKGKPVKGIEDGILTAYEVSNMYLPNTKLAVLSACETGLGDIQGSEGVYGLQRAFKMAGVENLVMSLWKVPDAETAEFMQEFYKNLFSGKTISDAFYTAQTVMKNKYRKEPYKWAAWVLVR